MAKVTFFGGAQEVTGSCFLFEEGAEKILIDCGLFQSPRFVDSRSGESFPFDPKGISTLFVTHAHIDHTGRIPKLVKDGFKGKIYSTEPTKELAHLMLEDSLGVLGKEAKKHGEEIFYDESNIIQAMKLWHGIGYHSPVQIGDLKITLRNSGHILGSAMVEIESQGKKTVFSGDLGNPPTPLLKNPEEVTDADFLIIESTYGNRDHEGREGRKIRLERVIEDTLHSGGVLMIPAFSLERTQEILFEINDLVESARIPKVPLFLDSPLAIKATAVYKKFENYFNKEANYRIKSGDDLFRFPGLTFTETTLESKSINDVPAPKIIIAGSGMSNGGRIIHHERRYLSDSRSTLLLVGYQAAGSMGRVLQDGAGEVFILGERVPVKCRIEMLTGYSAHPDKEQLFDFILKTKDRLKKLFAVQGEPASCLYLVQRVRDYIGREAYAPRHGETYEL